MKFLQDDLCRRDVVHAFGPEGIRAYRFFGLLALSGPLRTAPERVPGEGGCPAINPRHRFQWWSRWRCAQGRAMDRWTARRRFLMANAEWLGLSVRRAAEVLPMPVWRTS
jgi:hypothetical protein